MRLCLRNSVLLNRKRQGQDDEQIEPNKEPAIISVEVCDMFNLHFDFMVKGIFLWRLYKICCFEFQGRGFNVEIYYVEEPVPDYLRAVVSTVLSIDDQVC